jgi:TolB-like protein
MRVGDASQQYFSDGISEDLITALSQFPVLKVIGRTSSFQFRDSKEESRSIGAKLGVAHLLEGSMCRSGNVVRVSAELVNTLDGSAQWSERYDRPYKDLFALQDEITRAVVVALRARLLPGEHAAEQSDRPPGGSLEAYNALLQGRFYEQRGAEARSGLEQATRRYREPSLRPPHPALQGRSTLRRLLPQGRSASAGGRARAQIGLARCISGQSASCNLSVRFPDSRIPGFPDYVTGRSGSTVVGEFVDDLSMIRNGHPNWEGIGVRSARSGHTT